MNGNAGNRHNPLVRQNQALEKIARGTVHEVQAALAEISPDEIALENLALLISKTNASLDAIRKQLQPNIWETQIGINVAPVAPLLVVDRPISLTWLQIFFPKGSTVAGAIELYDQNGSNLKIALLIPPRQSGPIVFPATGITFRRNVAAKASNDDAGGVPPYPLTILMQGISIA